MPSPSPSRSPSPELQLDPSTLGILTDFLREKAAEEEQFQRLADERARQAEQQQQAGGGGELATEQQQQQPMLTVDEFRKVFGENFGMSQFWYSTAFAHRLADSLALLRSPRLAFLASPTAYVAFQHLHPQASTLLLEYDARFDVLPGEGFVKWDLFDPDRLPESARGTVELAVVDPPYLNEETNTLVAKSLAFLLNPTSARLLLLTSTSVPFAALRDIYGKLPQLGPLREVTSKEAKVEHDGGRIQNPFGMWASWDGGEAFMSDSQAGRQ